MSGEVDEPLGQANVETVKQLEEATLACSVMAEHLNRLIDEVSGRVDPELVGSLIGTATILNGVVRDLWAVHARLSDGRPSPEGHHDR